MSVDAQVRWIQKHESHRIARTDCPIFNVSESLISDVLRFHKGFPHYEPTPLSSLRCKAEKLGLGEIWIKDESKRFGLNAFKALGGTYAIGRWLGNRLGLDPSEVSFDALLEALKKGKHRQYLFVTATDGNHGRGVAWASRMLGCKAAVFMPRASAACRVKAIEEEGAEVFVTKLNYDDAVRDAFDYARANGAVMLQDTSWEGYEDVPRWIMEGYLSIIQETISQIRLLGHKAPTHVFLQAGVGSFAASMLAGLECILGSEMPLALIVEPRNAACIYESARSEDGSLVKVGGTLDTIMAGLACGEPNPIALGRILKNASFFASCEDSAAELGMRLLYNPDGTDAKVASGESGAIGMGLLQLIMEDRKLESLRESIGLNADSKVLLISTEGATDPDGFRRIVGCQA